MGLHCVNVKPFPVWHNLCVAAGAHEIIVNGINGSESSVLACENSVIK